MELILLLTASQTASLDIVPDLPDAFVSEWEQVLTATMFQHGVEILPRGVEAVIAAKGMD